MLLSTILALFLQEWDVGEVEMDRTFTKTFDLPAPAAKVIANCACFTTKLLEGDRRLEVTLSTKGLIGANVKAVQSVAADGTIHVIAIKFDVTTTNAGAKPQLSLIYESMAEAQELLLRLYELSQKRGCVLEVRMASRAGVKVDGLELRDGEKAWKGRDAVKQAILRLRADAGMAEPGAPPPPLPAGGPGSIDVYFFYSRSCGECVRMIERELPLAIAKRSGAKLVALDITEEANLRRLVGVLQNVKQKENTLPGILVGARYLGGFAAIRSELDGALAEAKASAPPEGDLRAAFNTFTLPAVLLAGAIDGLNPCAFATAVLLASFLAARRRRAVDIALAGGAFTLAVFATYLSIGFGLKLVATQFTGPIVNIVTAVVAGALALVSLRDAVIYAKTQDPSRLALQMPDMVVTLLEAVCTGQLYLPVIVVMTRETGRAHWMLVAYNLAFIVPLVVVLLAAVAGVKSPRLVDWSKRNVVVAKIAVAVVLAGMAVWLIA